VIRRLEVLAWFAFHPTLTPDERADAFAGLVGDGLLTVHSNGDAITALSVTPAGRALMPQTLPLATA
jgi:hypothetical protein